MKITEAIGSAGGDNLALAPLIIHRVRVPTQAGVNTDGYDMTIIMTIAKVHDVMTDESVIIEEGRFEVSLSLADSSASPFPGALASSLITDEEQRVARVTAS